MATKCYNKEVCIQGIDRAIVRVQKLLRSNIKWLETIYGKTNRNRNKQGSTVPEIHIGNGEYLNVLPDDNTSNSQCFFDVSNIAKRQPDGSFQSDCIIAFFVNLERLSAHYPDCNPEYLKENVTNLFLTHDRWFRLDSVCEGVNQVYKNFDVKPKTVDLYPNYIFGVDGILNHKYTCSC